MSQSPDFFAAGLPPVLQSLGAEIIERGEDRAILRFPFQRQFANPRGQTQGGIIGAMLDGAMAVAANGLATVAMQVTLLRPHASGDVTVTAEVVRRGRQILYCEAEARDGEARIIARGNQTAVPPAQP